MFNSSEPFTEADYVIPQAPHAGDGYVFYRDVVADYGADNTGATNTEEAINAAIIDGDRCGEECGNTFVKGALIYFPPGTYKVCTPIIQYYYTQFVGDPNDRPIIKGCDEFTGIALMDVDPYVPNMAQPDGRGVNWYINQNQFFRQIRNFVFDLTEMPSATDEHDQKLVPTGIHWQVSQACTLQNLLFRMPTASTDGGDVTHVGIFTENGSGGFVSDLEFEGGAIGWRVGSQQYTATSLKFRNCITAVQMVWDWGFNWHKIQVDGGSIAFNISGRGGVDGQGIGSISLIDSTISGVPIGILTSGNETSAPNIVIDNTVFSGVGSAVQTDGGEVLLSGSPTVGLWAHGRRYEGGDGKYETGPVQGAPSKPSAMTDGDGKLFTRIRPQYENLPASSFLIATEHGCVNDASGDNTAAINSFLQQAASSGLVAYFPAGIYTIQGTVTIPNGSKVQGTSWSQIQATGSYFQDMEDPKVAVRVGEEGDVGTMEIIDMMFTVKGSTAGVIMMEWNIHESSQGSAALWDSHIRVGGGIGTDLDVANCPKLGYNEACICATMLLHITKKASGYFENMWTWVADHDNDMSLYWEVDSSASQISLYAARGILIESEGPTWIYGSGSEHVIFYQYQTYKAKNVYLGHIQTESPYFQPEPVSPTPFNSSLGLFPGDPDWADCTTDSCREAWGLRVLDSESVFLHSVGLYSWFSNYDQQCLGPEDCQQRVMEVKGSKDVALFNIFSKAVEEIATGEGNFINQTDDNQRGYTTEPDSDGGDVVFIGTEVYTGHTAQCLSAPCVFVIAPTPLSEPTTITVEPYTTSLEVGASSGNSFVVTTTTITITVAPITTDRIPVSNVDVTRSATSGSTFNIEPSVILPPQTVVVTDQDGQTLTRTLTLPPWPAINDWPPDGTSGVPASTYTKPPHYLLCPPSTFYIPEQDAVITLKDCSGPTTLDWDCPATTTVTIDADTTVDFELGCTRWTGTTTEALPTYTSWPEGELEWVEEDGEDDDDDTTTTCKLWFFWICINWGDVKIGGWRWKYPRGILPPIGSNGEVTYPKEQPTDCETQTAELCSTTTSFGVTVSDGTSKTTTTATPERCTTIVGCNAEDDEGATTTSDVDACTIDLSPRTAAATAPVATTTATATEGPDRRDEKIQRRAPPADGLDHAILYPANPRRVDGILAFLQRFGYATRTRQITAAGFTAFFFITNMQECHIEQIKRERHADGTRLVTDAYGQYRWNVDRYDGRDNSNPQRRAVTNLGGTVMRNVTIDETPRPRKPAKLGRRDPIDVQLDGYYALSQISVPPEELWDDYAGAGDFLYSADDSFGTGQTIYFIEDGIDDGHSEFTPQITVGMDDKHLNRPPPDTFAPFDYGSAAHRGRPLIPHGTNVVSLAFGAQLGLAKRANIIVVGNENADPPDKNNLILERYLQSLVRVLEDVDRKGAAGRGKSIINMSFGWVNDINSHAKFMRESHWAMLYKILKELDSRGVVIVCAAHNFYQTAGIRDRLDGWPSRFGDPDPENTERIDNLIVVGGIEAWGRVSPISPYASWLIMAPGWQTYAAEVGGEIAQANGNSLAAPMVSALVAYWRGLPNKKGNWARELEDPANVKKLLAFMQRPLRANMRKVGIGAGLGDFPPKQKVPFIWTGQYNQQDCLVNPDGNKRCPRGSLSNLQPGGACPLRKRQDGGGDGDSCGLPGGGGGGDDTIGDPITYRPGSPSPTCTSGCGTLCRGYYCVPSPTGFPPDYYDPKDPNHQPSTTGRTDVPTSSPTGGTTTGRTDMPTLTTGSPYTGSECKTYTRSTVCNGSGGRSACVTQDLCVPTPPCNPTWSATGTPVCTGEFSICLSTSIGTRCPEVTAAGLAPTVALPNGFAPATPTPTAGFVTVRSPLPVPEPKPAPDAGPESPLSPSSSSSPPASQQAAAASELGSSSSWAAMPAMRQELQRSSINHNSTSLLFPRQENCGGVANGRCEYIRFCAPGACAKIDKIPCLKAHIYAKTGALTGTEVTATVEEDGIEVCRAEIKCKLWDKDCSGVDDYACGGDNGMGWSWNYILYTSAKYGANYPLYLDRTESDKVIFCFQSGRPAACLENTFDSKDGPCP
ncbi:Glucan 1-3-beta-glucosidase [Apiospora aurea]|uniref:Glucan 1-3-beta-glucosidase n=1 Tax=Apiospora aurea TaxID=335848 RepID=A0ABR1PZ59_9PEZI